MSLGKLFRSFGTMQDDVLDGAAMTAGAVAGVVAVNKVLGLKVGAKTISETVTGFLPAGKIQASAIPALKVVLGAVGPGLAMSFLPRNAWVKKGLDGVGIGLALSGWMGLARVFVPSLTAAGTESAAAGLLHEAQFGLLGGTPSFGGAQVQAEYMSGLSGANIEVESVGKFGGIGGGSTRYASILGG